MSRKVKHGLSKSKEYKCWLCMKSRCYNNSDPNYYKYGAIGIEVDASFVNDFTAFISEIGFMPDNTNRWTVDRIDGSLGYLSGNIRWATAEQQTRNRRKQSNNISGVTGVYWAICNEDTTYAVSSWYEKEGSSTKQKHKSFSVKKYGLLPAFAMAVDYRMNMINKLNSKGYGYSDNHGI